MKKLGDLERGDYVTLVHNQTKEKSAWEVTEYLNEKGKVFMDISNGDQKKSYSFMDENVKVDSPEHVVKCECCGHIKEG